MLGQDGWAVMVVVVVVGLFVLLKACPGNPRLVWVCRLRSGLVLTAPFPVIFDTSNGENLSLQASWLCPLSGLMDFTMETLPAHSAGWPDLPLGLHRRSFGLLPPSQRTPILSLHELPFLQMFAFGSSVTSPG